MPLTTSQRVKDFLGSLGEPVPQTHEPIVSFIVDAISDEVGRYCGRRFGTQAYTGELHVGFNDRAELEFNQWPVTTIASVSVDGTAITEGSENDQYLRIPNFDGEVWSLYRAAGWQSKPFGISLGYTAGYVLPAIDITTPTLPAGIESAVVELCVGTYLQRGKAGLSRETFEGLSIDMDRWPMRIKETLRRYKRMRV